MVFASLRIGLYEPVKNLIVGDKYEGGLIPIGYRILAALATGAIGITVANPTDVVKIRFQADGRLPKDQRRYRGVFHAYQSIIKSDG
jgi:solute carrier family 25 uncoupling protein 8/9